MLSAFAMGSLTSSVAASKTQPACQKRPSASSVSPDRGTGTSSSEEGSLASNVAKPKSNKGGKKGKGKKKKTTRKGAADENPQGPSLESLLGMSSDDEPMQTKVKAPARAGSSMTSLADMPALGGSRRQAGGLSSLKDMPPLF